jgi:hypothetical protein
MDEILQFRGLSEFLLSFLGIGQLCLLKNTSRSLNNLVSDHPYYKSNRPLFEANCAEDLPKSHVLTVHDVDYPILSYLPKSFHLRDEIAIKSFHTKYPRHIVFFCAYYHNIPKLIPVYLGENPNNSVNEKCQIGKLVGMIASNHNTNVDPEQIHLTVDFALSSLDTALATCVASNNEKLFEEIFRYCLKDDIFPYLDNKGYTKNALANNSLWVHKQMARAAALGKFVNIALRGRTIATNPYVGINDIRYYLLPKETMILLHENGLMNNDDFVCWTIVNLDVSLLLLVQTEQNLVYKGVMKKIAKIMSFEQLISNVKKLSEMSEYREIDRQGLLVKALCHFALQDSKHIFCFAVTYGWKLVFNIAWYDTGDRLHFRNLKRILGNKYEDMFQEFICSKDEHNAEKQKAKKRNHGITLHLKHHE